MNIEVIPYTLPLSAPIRIAGRELRERNGLLVRVESAGGVAGWGDAAPLPGFSRESVEQARAELESLSLAREFMTPADIHDWSASAPNLSSSARFSVESAIAEVASAFAKKTVCEWLFDVSADSCEVNALIGEEPEMWAKRAAEMAAGGYRTIKIKVGRFPIAHELAGLRAAVNVAPGIRFRLDANRSWIPLTARAFATEVAELPVEYIEEPFEAGKGMARGWPDDVAIAWDETLQEVDEPEEPKQPVKAWVLKPTLVGGLSRCLRLIERAKKAGCQVVFSSAYESGVGVRMLGELAAGTGGVAGLDTYRVLAEDVLEPRLKFNGGRLDLASARRSVVAR